MYMIIEMYFKQKNIILHHILKWNVFIIDENIITLYYSIV